MTSEKKYPEWLVKAISYFYERKYVLKSTEPMGKFCKGCDGKACWCQTWEWEYKHE